MNFQTERKKARLERERLANEGEAFIPLVTTRSTPQMISYCCLRRVYDPTIGVNVLSRAVPAPFAAIAVEFDENGRQFSS